jgi:hypothetical protein
MHQVKLHLNQMQWEWLSASIRKVAMVAPLKDYELSTCIIAEMYKRRLHSFTFYSPGKMGMCISLHQSEGYAINEFFGSTSDDYNMYIRIQLEPHLIKGK